MPACPYCGKENLETAIECFDCSTRLIEEELPSRPSRPISRRAAIIISLLLLYLPQCWVFFINSHDTNPYFWQKMFPVLPGLSAYFFTFVLALRSLPRDGLGRSAFMAAAFTALIIWGIVWATKRWRGKPGMVIACIVALSFALAWFGYGMYAM